MEEENKPQPIAEGFPCGNGPFGSFRQQVKVCGKQPAKSQQFVTFLESPIVTCYRPVCDRTNFEEPGALQLTCGFSQMSIHLDQTINRTCTIVWSKRMDHVLRPVFRITGGSKKRPVKPREESPCKTLWFLDVPWALHGRGRALHSKSPDPQSPSHLKARIVRVLQYLGLLIKRDLSRHVIFVSRSGNPRKLGTGVPPRGPRRNLCGPSRKKDQPIN